MKVTHDWYCTVRVLFICNRLLPTRYSARRRNSDQRHGDASGGSPNTFRHPGGRAVSQDIICEICSFVYIWCFKYFVIRLDVIIINRTVAPCEDVKRSARTELCVYVLRSACMAWSASDRGTEASLHAACPWLAGLCSVATGQPCSSCPETPATTSGTRWVVSAMWPFNPSTDTGSKRGVQWRSSSPPTDRARSLINDYLKSDYWFINDFFNVKSVTILLVFCRVCHVLAQNFDDRAISTI